MASQPSVRPARASDLEEIIELEHLCFKGPLAYSRRQFRYLLTKAHRTFLVETDEGHLRGFVIVLYRSGTRVAGLETINVDPRYRNQGIGLHLLEAAEREMLKKGMDRLRLEVSPGNHAAIVLYKKQGFTTTARLRKYYLYHHQGSRDALRMVKKLR